MTYRWLTIGGVAAILALAVAPVLGGPLALPAYGPGMMGGGCPGGPMGGWLGAAPGGQRLSMDQAVAAARGAVAALGNPHLVPAHVMEFTRNFYVVVKDTATGRGAFELLVDPYTGAVYPEPGPNMMWNTEYGHMHGAYGPGVMMGPGRGTTPRVVPVTREEATTIAQRWLDARMPGAKTEEVTPFPGYYTIDVTRGGKVVGMLSVNASTGQVWYHTWHGTFIREEDLD